MLTDLSELRQITFVGVLAPLETKRFEPVERWDVLDAEVATVSTGRDAFLEGFRARGFRMLVGDAGVMLIVDGIHRFAGTLPCALAHEQADFPHDLVVLRHTKVVLEAHNPTREAVAVGFQILRA